jgi:hypothetical protein
MPASNHLPATRSEQLHGPVGVAIDKEDRLVIVNETGNTVVRVDPKRPHEVALLAGAYRSKV